MITTMSYYVIDHLYRNKRIFSSIMTDAESRTLMGECSLMKMFWHKIINYCYFGLNWVKFMSECPFLKPYHVVKHPLCVWFIIKNNGRHKGVDKFFCVITVQKVTCVSVTLHVVLPNCNGCQGHFYSWLQSWHRRRRQNFISEILMASVVKVLHQTFMSTVLLNRDWPRSPSRWKVHAMSTLVNPISYGGN